MSLRLVWRWLRRLVVAVAGGLVLLVGLAMIVLPGPAFVVIPLGLGILALEFELARRWLKRARQHADGLKSRVLKRGSGKRSTPDRP
ncbi:MAG: hypothetical protein RL026_801 [Pseudomonadota bacterium]